MTISDHLPHPDPRFRSPAATTPLPLDRLAPYLADAGFALDDTLPIRQFASGLANLNYLIHAGGRGLVLRRPPPGDLPPGAHDMAREHRVLSRLPDAYPLAPRSLHLCTDSSIIGVPFQLIEYRPGLVIKGDDRSRFDGSPTHAGTALRSSAAHSVGGMMIETLAALHAVDPATVGLDKLGRPDGFTARQIAGWKARGAHAAQSDKNAGLIAEIATWLERQKPADRPACLLHCDFKLDNMILDPGTLQPVAVVDWDMSTRGDPLFDLATLLSYWTQAGDPPVMHRMAQMPSAAPGFPTRTDAVQVYARRTGLDVSDLLPFRVLAMLKLAVVFLQLHLLYLKGQTLDPRYADFGVLAHDLLEFTHDVAAGRAS